MKIMIDLKKIKNFLLLSLMGVLIYFAIIDIVIYLQVGIQSTPLDWIYVPIYNLVTMNWVAWVILIISLIIGWFFFIVNDNK